MIQGSAADYIKMAMKGIMEELCAKGLADQCCCCLQIHDELVFEVPEDQADRLIDLASKVMGEACAPAVELSVPLDVDAKAGKSWAEAH